MMLRLLLLLLLLQHQQHVLAIRPRVNLASQEA
jgi:hypothetical protein